MAMRVSKTSRRGRRGLRPVPDHARRASPKPHPPKASRGALDGAVKAEAPVAGEWAAQKRGWEGKLATAKAREGLYPITISGM